MNKYAYLLREIFECNTITQRELAEKMLLSLGSVNTLIKEALTLGYITKCDNMTVLTSSGLEYLDTFKVDRAIIMAVRDLFRLHLKLQKVCLRSLVKG